jgi:hypothetical protein
MMMAKYYNSTAAVGLHDRPLPLVRHGHRRRPSGWAPSTACTRWWDHPGQVLDDHRPPAGLRHQHTTAPRPPGQLPRGQDRRALRLQLVPGALAPGHRLGGQRRSRAPRPRWTRS